MTAEQKTARKSARKDRERARKARGEAPPYACVYLGPDRHEGVKARYEQLGYASLSEYVCALLDLGAELTATAAGDLRTAATLALTTPPALLARAVREATRGALAKPPRAKR